MTAREPMAAETVLTEGERDRLHQAIFAGSSDLPAAEHDEAFTDAVRAVERILAERVAQARAEAGAVALRQAADEMEAVIADGDAAEVAAPVSGEVGRSAVIARRDALYNDPWAWLRDRADRLAVVEGVGSDG